MKGNVGSQITLRLETFGKQFQKVKALCHVSCDSEVLSYVAFADRKLISFFSFLCSLTISLEVALMSYKICHFFCSKLPVLTA